MYLLIKIYVIYIHFTHRYKCLDIVNNIYVAISAYEAVNQIIFSLRIRPLEVMLLRLYRKVYIEGDNIISLKSTKFLM